MRLQARALVRTGIDMFDFSLGAMTVWENGSGVPLLLVNSGLYGG